MTVAYAEAEAKPGFDLRYAKARLDAMRFRARQRDQRQMDILAMRRGDYQAVAGDILPEDFDRGLVANLIDTAAHDLSEVMAPLPTISCASSSQTSQTKKDFANKRALIANHYIQSSRLSDQMYVAADRFASFGYFAYVVQPDFEMQSPVVRVSTSNSSYFTQDYRDRVVQYVEVMNLPCEELCHFYPELSKAFRDYKQGRATDDIEVAEWHDKDVVAIFVPDMNLILDVAKNPLGRPAVRVVGRPSIDGEKRGQFDDVIGMQVARAIIAQYTLSAVQQSVEAPIQVPRDMNEMDLGPFAAIQTDGEVKRVQLGVPQGLFPEQQVLASEQRVGSRYPEARSGNIDASIVTGQGVQALMGTFDTQIQAFQRINESALEDVVAMCFELDELLWPNLERSVRVKDSGSPVEITYKPSKDISKDYSCDVSYGAVAGLDPNRSLIFLLQAGGGGLLSKETQQKYLPIDLDHVAEMKRLDLEALRGAELSAIEMMAQAIPQMAANGQDPSEIVRKIADIIDGREKGKTINDAITEVLAPKQAEQPASESPDMAALMAAQAGAGAAPQGGPEIAAPQSPGQDLLMSLAGISPSGQANLQSNVSRRAIAR